MRSVLGWSSSERVPRDCSWDNCLTLEGIDNIVIEQRSRDYVEKRVRAGVIEHGIAKLLESAGAGARMLREGLVHHGVEIRSDGVSYRIPLSELADGRSITVYGQQEVVKDLIASTSRCGSTPVLRLRSHSYRWPHQ